MTNEEYFDILSPKIAELQMLRETGKSIAAGIIGKSLLKEGFFFCTATDRCMHLIDGLSSMLQERNLTCAGALLRLQLDNCMRTYAAFIADDKNAVIDCIISGNRINKQKSTDGKNLSDANLRSALSKIDSRFSNVYNQASGFIHLSEKAFYQTVVRCEDSSIEFQIGGTLPEKRNPVLIECADAFIHFTKLHFKMLTAVAESKTYFDLEYEQQTGRDKE